jgi:hypothetical protein
MTKPTDTLADGLERMARFLEETDYQKDGQPFTDQSPDTDEDDDDE